MTSTKAEEITNPRRILAVALTDSSDHLGAVIRGMSCHISLLHLPPFPKPPQTNKKQT